ncbi:hypothetical protein [Pasteuria penetrans]|nr:hypothetical protein [Pasteuria penetrans]
MGWKNCSSLVLIGCICKMGSNDFPFHSLPSVLDATYDFPTCHEINVSPL